MKNNITNKKNITLFFCDIYGTIDDKLTEEDCREFSILLEEIIKQNGSDYLFFAMASTENQFIVDNYEEKLTAYFQKNVKILPKLPENKDLSEAKVAFIINYINYILEFYTIEEIYLADDSVFNQEFLKDILYDLTKVHLKSIIPTKNNNNLKYINDSIKEILSNKKQNYISKNI